MWLAEKFDPYSVSQPYFGNSAAAGSDTDLSRLGQQVIKSLIGSKKKVSLSLSVSRQQSNDVYLANDVYLVIIGCKI